MKRHTILVADDHAVVRECSGTILMSSLQLKMAVPC
jgi:hypothetical protein